MKCFVVLFFALLTETSFAKECCSNETLNVTFLIGNYQRIVAAIMVPSIQYGDQSAAAFKNSSVQAILDYGLTLLTNIHDQALYAGDELICNITNDYDKLQDSIKLIHKYQKTPICLEKALEKLTDQLWTFLKLKPGNGTINRPVITPSLYKNCVFFQAFEYDKDVLPSIPAEQIKVKSITTRQTAEDIFVNGELTIFSMSLQIYAYLTYVFQTILNQTITLHELVRTQLNDEILNCSVMGAYRKIVVQIFEQSCLIRSNVSRGTWNCFKEAGDRILDISKAYCKALKNKKKL